MLWTFFALSAGAQTFDLTRPGGSLSIDLTDPRLDLGRVLRLSDGETTIGEVVDGVIAAGERPESLLNVSIDGDTGDLVVLVDAAAAEDEGCIYVHPTVCIQILGELYCYTLPERERHCCDTRGCWLAPCAQQ